MKVALLFPGNLGSYAFCIDQFKYMIEKYDVDIYILYSDRLNYVHSLNERNININVDINDINLIKESFGSKLKYLNHIENINCYTDYEAQNIKIFEENIKWVENEKDQLINLNNYEKKRKYIDTFLRLNILINEVINYEKTHNFEYNYIFRFRIDQFISCKAIDQIFDKLRNANPDFYYLLDNCFIFSRKFISCVEFLIHNVGKYQNNKSNYKIGQEIQVYNTFADYCKLNNIQFEYMCFNIGLSPTTLDCIYIYTSRDICFSVFLKQNNMLNKCTINSLINFPNYFKQHSIDKSNIVKHNLHNKYNLELLVYTIISRAEIN